MSKLPIQIQILLGFIALNLILLVVGQPLILIESFIDEQTKLTILRIVATIGMLSLVTVFLNKNTRTNA